ncbi:cysteine proteinase falcipain 1 [Plasmodium sp. gorilla clade G2]|uniref:cysteine proteinase falcipain 1 n=1 Tax=Plasmodium sp. gorilla clade G2 TaxID=880535 RepID=UPI000D20304A|nr:cysteine proteinase falcipain 1 [Plasmodium sp. gorilla clade G2]SOV19651.1 cysteine proteinase falcipain 1 [Plasmodium sp. gorilla clade G2]
MVAIKEMKELAFSRPSLVETLNKKKKLLKKKEKRTVLLCTYAFITFIIFCIGILYYTNKSSSYNNNNNNNNNNKNEYSLKKEEIELLRVLLEKYKNEKDGIMNESSNEVNDKNYNSPNNNINSYDSNVSHDNIKSNKEEYINLERILLEKYKKFIEENNDENRKELSNILHKLLEINKLIILEEKDNKKVYAINDKYDEKGALDIGMMEEIKYKKEDPINNIKYASKFFNFMKEHNKVYKSLEEQMRKFEIFKMNYISIKSHNKLNKNAMYKKKVNQFSDYSEEELKQYFKKLLPVPKHMIQKYVKPLENHLEKNRLINEFYTNGKRNDKDIFMKVPEILDYREKGIVHEPKDQGLCGSCWAFASVGNIESVFAKKNKSILSFSEQEVVDCSKDNFGCDGGHPFYSFLYVLENQLCLGDEYKYKAKDDMFCLNYRCKRKVSLTSIGGVKENQLILALNEVGPLSVNVGVNDDFISYSEGVYNGTCSEDLNHSVLLVGYGQVQKNKLNYKHNNIQTYNTTENFNQQDDNIIYYWIIKNSWSKKWGENGFMRLSRNKNGDNVFCGIGVEVFYPIL